MRILWLTWKDLKHPQAGGAEVVNEELAKRLAAEGHEVKLIVGGFPGGVSQEIVDGYEVSRLGNRFTVYYKTWRYYRRHLRDWPDLVIDEVNTIPFFAKFYVKQRNILLVYQLAREIWFYQMVFPLSVIGYLMEPLYLRLLRDRLVLTESQSTKDDLVRQGFKADNIKIFPIGISMKPVETLETVKKYAIPTILSLGAVRPMKRTLDQVKAFEFAKPELPELQLIVAGDISSRYGKKVERYIQRSQYAQDIQILGKIAANKKVELLQKCHILLATSLKEGWGLTVTEAASQGTPAIAYDVDGLRDSIKDNVTGCAVSNSSTQALAETIVAMLQNRGGYEAYRKRAWHWSQEFIFERAFATFKNGVGV